TKRQNLFQELDAVIHLLMEARSEERFSRNAETDLVCRLLLEKKKAMSTLKSTLYFSIEITCFSLAIKPLRCRSTAIFRLKRITYSNGTAIRQSNWSVSIILGCMCLT